jgi:outer membrane immunogenic protein
MKRLLLASAAVAAFAAPAFAADLPAAPYYPTKAPAYVAAYNWSGFYLGVNLGGGWARNTVGETFFTGATTNGLNTATGTINGVIGGGQIGYNWQSGNLLFGLEADVDGSGQSGTLNSALTVAPNGIAGADSISIRVNSFGTARGRVGFAADRWLWYVTGGFAWQNVSFGETFTPTGGTLVGVNGASSTRAGYSVGGGVETALWGNWTGRVEYLYLDTGTWSFTNPAVPQVAPPGFTGATTSIRTQNNVVRAGLNFRF